MTIDPHQNAGELIAFILRTARDFATRQTKNNEAPLWKKRPCYGWLRNPAAVGNWGTNGYPLGNYETL